MHRQSLGLLVAVLITLALPGPSPTQGETESDSQSTQNGMLILNEICPSAEDGGGWVELINPTETEVPIADWTISFLSGYEAEFPVQAPDCPGGSLVMVTFGDLFSNYQFGSRTCYHMHVPDPGLNSEGDGCIVSGPDGPIDAITWGHPPLDTDVPLSAGSPLRPIQGYIPAEADLYQAGDVLVRVPDTWPPSLENWVGSQHWVYRRADSATPGDLNPAPGPRRFSPEDGAHVESSFTLYIQGTDWSAQTTFQIATDQGFQDVVLEETVEGRSLHVDDFPEGTYYWRVRGYTGDPPEPGPWSESREFTCEPINIDEMIEAAELEEGSANRAPRLGARLASHKGGGSKWLILTHHVIPCPHIEQSKDTRMVCIDGCPMFGNCQWCAGHPSGTNCKHGDGGCTRASLAMAAAANGCSLSQDRITYYLFEEAGNAAVAARESGHIGDPWRDLGHDVGTDNEDAELALAWIYGQPKSAVKTVLYHSQIFDDLDRSDMDTIREFILDNRAVLRHSPDHSTLIVGCAILLDRNGNEVPFIKVNDPGSPGNVGWKRFDSPPSKFKEFTFPPTTGRPVRNDEPEVRNDSDGDGLVDFDEERRFRTDPTSPDTDLDGVHDMQDIVGYVFRSDGSYRSPPRNPDMDGDGAWKELDPDNDWANDSSMMDGCEDMDADGFYDSAIESDCFNHGDDFKVFNPDCVTGLVVHDMRCFSEDEYSTLTSHWLESLVIEDQPLNSQEYVHKHTWSFSFADTPHPPPDVSVASQYAYKEGSGLARIALEVDENGEYWARWDVQPSQTSIEYTYSWPEIGEHVTAAHPLPFYFGLGPTYRLGKPERTPGGALMLRGQLGPEGRTIPLTREPTPLEPDCTVIVWWEIILEHPQD